MFDAVLRLVGSLGYTGVALLMIAENVILPLPSELIMPLAGFESSSGRLSLWEVIVAGTLGSTVGAVVVYAIARRMGQDHITYWVDAHGRWFFVRGRDVQKASHRFERYGLRAILIGRLLPGVRGLIALPAGFAAMNVFVFVGATLLSTFVWCAALAVAGRLLGTQYSRIHAVMGPLTWGVLGAGVLWGGWWIVQRRRQHTKG